MTDVQPLTRDGSPWEPLYLDEIDPEACIGCGRCFKVCGQSVLTMMALDEDGNLLEAGADDMERMIMTIEHKGKCIGCRACARVCGAKAQKHVGPGVPLAS